MSLPVETAAWTVSPHAKQRAWERYGIVFAPKKWAEFCKTLQKEKHSLRLGSDSAGSRRFACYFQKQWFLIGCSVNGRTGIISTFLPKDALTDADKAILQSDDRYRQQGDDPWNVMLQRLPAEVAARKRANLPAMHVSQEELPSDFDQVGELLEKELAEQGKRS